MDHSTQKFRLKYFQHSACEKANDSQRRLLARSEHYFRARVSSALFRNDSYHIIGACEKLVLIV